MTSSPNGSSSPHKDINHEKDADSVSNGGGAGDPTFLHQPRWRIRGSDGEAESQIQAIAPHYEPWFQPLYEPASGEIESLLFTLQGSLGAAVIFYILGYTKGRQRRDDRS